MIFSFGDFEFDDERLRLRRAGQVLKTEAVVKRLLAALVRRAGELVTKEQLIEEVWEGRAIADNVITVAMARLRKTLSTGRGEREHVLTVYGRGYRFVGPLVTREQPEPHTFIGVGDPDRAPSPFVGRDRVIDRLEGALADARRGRGRMCVLMGEPGIGKTRAVEAFEQRLANSQVRVAWGFCREVGDTPPLSPWMRLLREVAASDLSKTPALTGLGPAVSELSNLLRPVETNATPEPMSKPLSFEGSGRHESFDVFARAFASAAAETPWVLVLDDLHRADAASLELLSYLIDEIAHSRILIIATLRHASGRRAPRPETHLPYVLGHRNCERIALDRLHEADVATYVGALIEDSDGTIAHAIYAKSEGNPFFMTELSRQLRDGDKLNPAVLSVPDIALDLIRQRVGKLEPAVSEVLAAAAVIGRTFELGLLQMVTGLDSRTLMKSLDEAIAADLVVAAPDSNTAFAFGHDLMRAVLYDALPPEEQRRWHIRAADALEKRAETGDDVPPSELAFHLHAALPESDLRKTVKYCRLAAAHAAHVVAPSDVVRYMRHALQALALMERPSARLRLGMSYVITIYGRGQPSTEYVRWIGEVLRLARELEDPVTLLRTSIMLNAYPGFKPVGGARAALESALHLLPADLVAGRAIGLAALATTAPYCYSAEQSRAMLEEATPLAYASPSRAARYVLLVTRMYVRGGPAHAAEAERDVDELAQMHRANPTQQMAIAPLYIALYTSVTALQKGDMTTVGAILERGLAKGRELRNMMCWHFERWQAMVQINSGQWSDGIATLVTQHRRAEQHSVLGTEAFCAFDRLVVFGELAERVITMDDNLRAALDYDPADPPSIWSMKVRALASAGLVEEAHAALRAVSIDALAQLPCDNQYLGTLGHLTQAALRLGALDYAAALYPLLAKYPNHFAANFSFLVEGSVPQLLGMLAIALERHGEARAHLEAGLARNEQAGFVARVAETELLLSTHLLEHGNAADRERALTLARKAQRTAVRIGMRSVARRAAGILKT
ncbi:MAG: AAA family ATPase [Polyangiales bacterium]